MSVVLDACVVAALIVDDPRQAAVQTALDGWLRAGQELHAPSALPYEVADVLARRVFDGDLDASEVPDLWGDVADLGLVLHPFQLVRLLSRRARSRWSVRAASSTRVTPGAAAPGGARSGPGSRG